MTNNLLISLFFALFAIFSVTYGQTPTPCRPQEVYDRNKCFLFVNQRLNFATADSYCKGYGYTLASVHSVFENRFLEKEAGDALDMTYLYYFIGLYSPNQNGQWVYTDSTQLDYTNWFAGEPVAERFCVAMRLADGQWQTMPCTNEMPFACSGKPGNPGNVTMNPPISTASPTPQRLTTTTTAATTTTTTTTTTQQPTTTQQITTTPKHTCPRNWGFYLPTFNCYLLKPYSTFYDYENRYCNGTIRSAGENEYIRDFAAGFFSGLGSCFTGNFDNEMYMIGRAQSIGGDLYWEDNEPLDYYPQNNCPSLLIPPGMLVPIIAVVDYSNQNVCWNIMNQTDFGRLDSSCQYFLCKQDGH